MARKKKVVEEVEDAVVEAPKAKAAEPTPTANDKIPDVVYSTLNLINVADKKTLLNAGLNENTIVRCLDTNDMYAPTKSGTVCSSVEQLDADGVLMKIVAA